MSIAKKSFTLPSGQSVSELQAAVSEWLAANVIPQGCTLHVVLERTPEEQRLSVGHALEDM